MKDRATEMKALLDQFREAMARENEALVYDKTARERIGEMIGRVYPTRWKCLRVSAEEGVAPLIVYGDLNFIAAP